MARSPGSALWAQVVGRGWSCRIPRWHSLDHGLQRADIVSPREGKERLGGAGPVRGIRLEDALDQPWAVLGPDVAIDFARDPGIRPEAATHVDMEAVDRVVAVGCHRHPTGDKAQVADIVLRA